MIRVIKFIVNAQNLNDPPDHLLLFCGLLLGVTSAVFTVSVTASRNLNVVMFSFSTLKKNLFV